MDAIQANVDPHIPIPMITNFTWLCAEMGSLGLDITLPRAPLEPLGTQHLQLYSNTICWYVQRSDDLAAIQ